MLLFMAALLIASAPISTQSAGCATVSHIPAADVEYREGVDAEGYAIAPADLTPPVLSKDDFRRVPIPLNIPLKNYPARNPEAPAANADLSESWVQPGLMTVDTQMGKVAFDSKDLTAPEPAELNPDCWE